MNRLAACLFLGVAACRTVAMASDPPREERPAGLTLQEVVRLALSRSTEARLADAQAERAGEALREARASNLPQIVVGTGLAYNNGFPLSIEGSAPSAFQVGLSQPILSKKNRNLILEAQEGIKAVKTGTESTRNELGARVALLYYDLNQARKLETLWAARLDGAKKEQQVGETLLEAGKLKPTDITLLRTAAAGSQYQLAVAQEQARLAETELCMMTGLAAIRTLDPVLDPQILGASSDALYQKALENHPDIRVAELNLRGKEYHVEAEKGGRYPRVDFVSEYALFTRFNNYQDYFNRFTRNNYLVGMSIQVPIFDGFLTSSRVGQSRAEVSEARLRLESLKTNLKLSIERAVSGLRIALGAADLARREQEAAADALKISQTLLEGGRISPNEVYKAQNLLRDKEIAIVEADRVSFQRQVELLKLSGGIAAMF